MAYKEYETKLTPLCPVAVKLGQLKVHAPDHDNWGVISCDKCEDTFSIGPNRTFGSRRTAEQCVAHLELLLENDHRREQEHATSYQFAD